MDRVIVVIVSAMMLLAALGFLVFPSIAGNTTTGSVVKQQTSNDYFKMDVFESELNNGSGNNATQNISGSK